MIRDNLLNTKIKTMQFDPFGYCNARCWFCPVKYLPTPPEGRKMMPVELVDKIFRNIYREKTRVSGLVDPSFETYWTAHYNEILLYKHLEQLLQITRKYKFRIVILSNGTTLTPERSDLLKEYRDVVAGVGLNVPAFERELWAKRAGFPESKFDTLIENINYYISSDSGPPLSIQINCPDSTSFEHGGLEPGPEFESLGIDLGSELNRQTQIATDLFPSANVIPYPGLVDRAGLLSDYMKHKYITADRRVTRCTNFGDRINEWLHINASGQAFLCCNDFDYQYVFGDFNTQELSQFWASEKHVDTINTALSQICRNCVFAV